MKFIEVKVIRPFGPTAEEMPPPDASTALYSWHPRASPSTKSPVHPCWVAQQCILFYMYFW